MDRGNYFSDVAGLLLLYGYDLKHTEGHADILRAAALHARMTEDRAWGKSVAPKLRAACDFIVRQRKAWNAPIPEGVWAKGLQGPMSAGDGADLAWYYLQDETMCVALRQVAQVLVDKATPRVWLEQGKKISVKNSPTYFGTLAYEIASDVDNGKISATVEMPAHKAPKEVVLRFRHPKSAPMKGVTVNGKPCTEFSRDKETITLKGLTGTAAVTAQY